MGIPSYFSHIVKTHRKIIEPINQILIHNLYLDCNSIIYDSIRLITYNGNNEQFETYLINMVCSKLAQYISNISPTKRVFVAFDGVAPVAKLEQQRNRRYKSWFQNEVLKELKNNESSNSNEWDATCITPGTRFMQRLGETIKEFFKPNQTFGVEQIIISCSDEHGEGEHKIYEYIRNNPEYHKNTHTVIYGLDADLIMLTLNHIHITRNLYLFRETPHFIKHLDNTLNPNELYMMDIPELANVITYMMNNDKTPETTEKYNNLLFDYILMCFLLGNDFMPHFPSINIRTNGIDILMNAYRHVFFKNKEGLTNGKRITWKHFRKFIECLKNQELPNMQNEMNSRDRMETKYLGNSTLEDKEYKFLMTPIKNRDIEKYINPLDDGWEYRYYKSLFNVEIDDSRRHSICKNYLEGIEWTIKYYTTGCADWRWHYKYDYAPLLQDLIKYIPYFDVELITPHSKSREPVNPLVQLCYVLPRNSLHLLPEPIYRKLLSEHNEWYGTDYEFKWAFCKYFWEAHAIMPEIDLNILERFIHTFIKVD
jgi:5'-3' exonuclease